MKNLKVRSLTTMAALLCAATMAWGQAVPSQIANIQLNNNNGPRGGNTIQIQYMVNGQHVNQSTVGYIQYDMSVFPASLTTAQIQKATLVLYVENGGNAGTVSLCQVASSWTYATITGNNAPTCVAGTSTNIVVTAAQIQNGAFISQDVTSIVRSWYNNPGTNYGFMLGAVSPSNLSLQFDALQGSNGYPPMLDLVVQNLGPQGPQGPQGPTGPTGPQGLQGPMGLTGATGATGAQGLAGPKGDTGAMGAQGLAGPQGPPGATGPQGPAGTNGTVTEASICQALFANTASPTTSCAALLGSVKFVFVTVGLYDGNLGGVAGADAKCQAEAVAGGYPGTYRAWLSDSLGDSPSTTFTRSPVPYINTDATGTQVVANWTVLAASGTTNIKTLGGGGYPSLYLWDSTFVPGGIFDNLPTYTCSNWTSNSSSQNGTIGTPGEVGTSNSYLSCNQQLSLTCFQQ